MSTEDFFEEYDDDMECCPRCNGLRTVDCHCGGDLCVCDNNGEKDCPLCWGEGEVTPDRAEKYLRHEAEMMEAFRAAMERAGKPK